MTVEQIADYMGLTVKAVQAHMPYTKGSYSLGGKTPNAERIRKHREAKKEKESE